jgi:preprotein translocase subunit SecD
VANTYYILHQDFYWPISGGIRNFRIFDVTETKDLANVLRAGKLPASADIIQSEVVGPSLGQKQLKMVHEAAHEKRAQRH